MEVNEQLLMSFSIVLDKLGDRFAARPESLGSLLQCDLLDLSNSLHYCQTQLTELLASRSETAADGAD